MSQSVEPLALNGNRPNLSDPGSVLAYWVADTLDTGMSGNLDPATRRLAATCESPLPTVAQDTTGVGKMILVNTHREDVATVVSTPAGRS